MNEPIIGSDGGVIDIEEAFHGGMVSRFGGVALIGPYVSIRAYDTPVTIVVSGDDLDRLGGVIQLAIRARDNQKKAKS